MTPGQERLTMNLVAAACTLMVLIAFGCGFHYRTWRDMRRERIEDKRAQARLPRATKR